MLQMHCALFRSLNLQTYVYLPTMQISSFKWTQTIYHIDAGQHFLHKSPTPLIISGTEYSALPPVKASISTIDMWLRHQWKASMAWLTTYTILLWSAVSGTCASTRQQLNYIWHSNGAAPSDIYSEVLHNVSCHMHAMSTQLLYLTMFALQPLHHRTVNYSYSRTMHIHQLVYS